MNGLFLFCFVVAAGSSLILAAAVCVHCYAMFQRWRVRRQWRATQRAMRADHLLTTPAGICMDCQVMYRSGAFPASHGLCPPCAAKRHAEIVTSSIASPKKLHASAQGGFCLVAGAIVFGWVIIVIAVIVFGGGGYWATRTVIKACGNPTNYTKCDEEMLALISRLPVLSVSCPTTNDAAQFIALLENGSLKEDVEFSSDNANWYTDWQCIFHELRRPPDCIFIRYKVREVSR